MSAPTVLSGLELPGGNRWFDARVARIATLVVTSEVMREQQVAAVAENFDAWPEFEGRFEQRWMSEALLEHFAPSLGEQSLMLNMRARPDPQIAGCWTALVAEQDACQKRE